MSTNSKQVILIVDDEPNIRQGMRWALERFDAEILDAPDGEAGLEILRSRPVDLLLTDLRMPRLDGTSLIQQVKSEMPDIAIIIITGHGTVESAVEFMKNGVDDYLLKPVSLDELTTRVERILKGREREQEFVQLQERVDEKFGLDNIVGNSKSMMDVFSRVRTVAPSRAGVLIYGESGTGKELVAEAIHHNSPRKHRPFVKINCGALPLGLLESELFGHEKGAFTSAVVQRKGRFELADGGTIFLDEISETAPEFQVKLLRVLQEGTFERVGGTETLRSDVRVIAASNRRLGDLVKAGKFREDLFYRLKVVELILPPLRDRRDDIPLLVDHFLEEFSQYYGRKKPAVSLKAMQALARTEWPGNVRQLRNVIEGLMVMVQGDEIDLKHLPEDLRMTPVEDHCLRIPVGMSLADVERELIVATLRANDNHRAKTARILGIGRKTLYRRLEEYGLNEELGSDEGDADDL